MKINKLFILTAATAIALMGAGCSGNGSVTTNPAPTDEGMSVVVEQGAPQPGIFVKAGLPAVSAKYEQNINLYGVAGARFQFVNCVGSPGSFTLKKGTNFMLDNRDADGHTFAIGAKTYNLGAYQFAIVSMPKAGTYNITCDKGGSAQVIVQN